MDWTGSLTDGDDLIKGKINIPNLSEENEPEDITVSHQDDLGYKHEYSQEITKFLQEIC